MSKYKINLHNDNRASLYVKGNSNEANWVFVAKYHNLNEAVHSMRLKASEEIKNGVVRAYYYDALGREEVAGY